MPSLTPVCSRCLFFFKQKTAYEIKECDWSSDVCSSDLLTGILSFICILASFGFEHWHTAKGIKGYFALFLLLEAGMMGVFESLDFFLFYVFWEMMLLPMYFLIGIWGGPRREYAAIRSEEHTSEFQSHSFI